MTTRTHFSFRVDTWTPDGESIVEHLAGIEDYQVALATFRAACERWPGTPYSGVLYEFRLGGLLATEHDRPSADTAESRPGAALFTPSQRLV
jgi:hypothetical protein